MDGMGGASPNRISIERKEARQAARAEGQARIHLLDGAERGFDAPLAAVLYSMVNMPEYVGLWFQRALADAKSARALAAGDAVLALYLIQQSVEKACKALLLEWGDSFDAIVKINHSSPKVFLRFAAVVREKADTTLAITRLVGENGHDALDRFVNDPEQRAKLAVMPPEDVSALFSVRNVLDDQRTTKLKHFPRRRKLVVAATSTGHAGMVAHEVAKKFPNLHRKDTLEFARFLISIHWSDLPGATGRLMTVSITKRQLDWYLKRVNAYVRLFVLSAVTFPHEAYARYPARPDSPPDGLEAIKGKRRGKFGIQHYDSRIGVFALITDVIAETEAVLKDLTAKMPSPSPGQ